MTFQPRIFTFYSYKGGVGRSMALLNMAYYLHARGRHVLIVDLDLEAPGASGFLHRTDELLPRESTGDVVDLLQKVVSTVKDTPPGVEPPLPTVDLSHYLRSVRLDKYAAAAHQKKPQEPQEPRARLDVLGAEQGTDYIARFSALELSSLSANQVADASDLLRGLLIQHTFPHQQPWQQEGAAPEATHYDYILVDSRTGLSEIGGLCVGPLSDRLVVLCGLNDQNIEGTRHFMDVVGLKPTVRPATGQAWDDADLPTEGGMRPASLGPKPTLLVASPVPGGEILYKKQRLEFLEKKLGMPPAKLSYHPQMALMETIFVRDHADEYLALEYATLAERVMSMVGDTVPQLLAPIQRWEPSSHGKMEETPDPTELKQRMARSALAGGVPDAYKLSSLMDHLGLSSEARDEIRRLQINLAPSEDLAAELWLAWADALDTEEARKAGNPTAFQAMEEKYQKATSLRPKFHRAFNNWGIALKEWAQTLQGARAENLFSQACEKYQQATVLNPKYAKAFNNWGDALLVWAQTKEGTQAEALLAQAEEKLQRALAVEPENISVWFNLGCLASLRGDVANTVAALERWKAANPTASKTKLDHEKDFDRVRDDPRFKALRDELRE